MNIKRAIGFGAILWVVGLVVVYILMLIPWFRDGEMRVQIGWWVLEIPAVLLLAKWYFKQVQPTIKNGARLGIASIVVGVVLDMIITVPLFVKSYAVMYSDWTMYASLLLAWVLCIYAGYEFDGTYTKPEIPKIKSE